MKVPKPHVWQQGHGLLSKLRRVYTKSKDHPIDASRPPPISQSTAVLVVLCFTVLYVAPFYVSASLRVSSSLARDDPTSIRARTRSVYLTCALTTCVALYILTTIDQTPIHEICTLLGLWPLDLLSVIRIQGLVAILFAGPLFEHILVESAWRTWSWRQVRQELWSDWRGYRNLIVGPVSEEYIFRGLATSLFLLSDTPATRIVFLSPMIFGLAHIHHFNEGIISCKDDRQSYLSALLTPRILLPALIRTVVQFSYTSLFGVFETFVLLRSGNLYACVLTHTFCNWLGLPRFWGRVGVADEQDHHHHIDGSTGSSSSSIARSADSDKRDDDGKSFDTPVLDARTARQQVNGSRSAGSVAPPRDLGLQWTVVYYVLLVGGTIAFAKLLWPLTASERALAQI